MGARKSELLRPFIHARVIESLESFNKLPPNQAETTSNPWRNDLINQVPVEDAFQSVKIDFR